MFTRSLVELLQHHAGLYSSSLFRGIEFEDSSQMLAAIDDQSAANRLPGKAGSATTRDDGDVMFLTNLHRALQVISCSWQKDCQRFNLVNAGIGAVKLPARRAGLHFTSGRTLQVAHQSISLNIVEGTHGAYQATDKAPLYRTHSFMQFVICLYAA